ncbi:MAG TPA: MFS transporter [Propionibacteriaceae bacterium]|nr:MFS transporter [Propionibacteriaceae bacterium]
MELLRRSRPFRWYWVGQSLSFFGSQVAAVALPLVAALSLDAGPAGVSAVATAAMLPNLLFSLLVGNWAEGRDHRRIMIPADVVRALLIAVIPVAWLAGALSLPLLAVVAFLTGVTGIFFEISGFAYVPSLVPARDLAAANRAVQGSSTVTEVAGPGLAGLLVQGVGPPLAMVVGAVSYLASALGVLLGRKPADHRRAGGSADEAPEGTEPTGVAQGLKVLFGNPYLRALTVHAAAYNLAEQIVIINLVLWAVQGQGVPPGAYGLALSAGGVGALLGTLTALRLADRLGFGRAFAVSLLLSCFVPLLLAVAPLRSVALATVVGGVMLVAGIGLGNANVYSLTLRQTVIPRSLLTRSAGAYRQVMYGSIPLGSALAGVIGELAGTRLGMLIGSVGLALSALPMLTRRIRALRDLRPEMVPA